MLLVLASWRCKDPMLLQRLLACNMKAAGSGSIRCALLKKQFPHLPSLPSREARVLLQVLVVHLHLAVALEHLY